MKRLILLCASVLCIHCGGDNGTLEPELGIDCGVDCASDSGGETDGMELDSVQSDTPDEAADDAMPDNELTESDTGADIGDVPDESDTADADTNVADTDGLTSCEAFEPGRTVGTRICNGGVEPGYTLFSPIGTTDTWLVDLDGRVVHQWTHSRPPGQSVELLADGRLLRPTDPGAGAFGAVGQGGGVELIAWDGTVEWSLDVIDDDQRAHHDVEMLPNGNIVLIVWERVSEEDATAAGRRTPLGEGELWPDFLMEVRPEADGGATVVWEWHVWDHLVQSNDDTLATYGEAAENPGRIDVDFGGTRNADWLHINAVAYDSTHDQLVLSVHNTSEVWIIDHATTTEEAAGAAGDILYRWGNPQSWSAGTPADRRLYLQHDAQLIGAGLPGAGNLLLFNNGDMRTRTWSSVDEMVLPRLPEGGFSLEEGAFGPDAALWSYSDPDSFDSDNISGAQRLADGTTLICEGAAGRVFQVSADGEIVWEYRLPIGRNGRLAQGSAEASRSLFRANRYAADFPGLAGRELAPGDMIEQ